MPSSIPLTGIGSFFQRQCEIINEFNRAAAVYGTPPTAGVAAILAQFASSDQAAVANLPGALTTYQQSGNTYLNTLIQDGQQAMLLQAADYVSVVPYSWQQAVSLVAAQMVSTAQSIQRPTLGSTITASFYSTNFSDATLAIGFTNAFGDQLDMTIAETITVTCTQPSPSYQERLSAIGQAQVPNTQYNWPNGSGANYSFSITDPNTNGLVSSGGFQTWTGTGNNTPPSPWLIRNGAAGTTVFRGSPGFATRTPFAAQLTSDGSQTTSLYQTINVQPNTVYAFCFYGKISSSDGAGIVQIALVDENSTIIQNSEGVNQAQTYAMNSAITTSYQCFTVFFQTPRQLPTTVAIQIGFSTPPTSGKSLFISMAGGTTPTQLYSSGPYIAAFAGANQTALGDNWIIAVTNSLGVNTFVMGSNRLYGFANQGLYFPSSGSPTIPFSP